MRQKTEEAMSPSSPGILQDIRVISFDAGFTLIYTEPSVGTVYAEIAAKFGFHLNADKIQERFLHTWQIKSSQFKQDKINAFSNEKASYLWWKDIFSASIALETPPDTIDAMFHTCFNEYAKGKYWRVYPEVISTLSTLKAMGFRLVVLSNWDNRLLRTLKELALDTYFDHIYISTVIGKTKPQAESFHMIINDQKISPYNLLHVGDTWEEDIIGAQKAGIPSVWLNRHNKQNRNTNQTGIPVISGLNELIS